MEIGEDRRVKSEGRKERRGEKREEGIVEGTSRSRYRKK
jgi:hypothetical protein